MNRFQSYYENVIRPDLLLKHSYTNVMEVPHLKKIVLNMGVKDVLQDKKHILTGMILLERISGQRPTVNRAKKSVSSYQLKEETILGCKVSLTGDSMYEFLDKLVTIVLPRVKDLKPLRFKSFDGQGNYSLGMKDTFVFPEIESEYGRIPKTYGFDIHFITTAKTDDDARSLLSAFQLPFENEKGKNE
uniref:Ribosomal protein L5 n=1 Tax=Andalucia godoyi TaxID=505711 RepID=M4QBL9_ANDGO|nr:ribosomal protein L5 [Andalucia godoyi]AGH23984.1 ribosomal protein L5 [Andalucia godoyi]